VKRTAALVRKELRVLQRNPLVLFIALVMPAVMMGAACLAFSGEMKSLPVGLVKEDDGDLSVSLSERIRSGPVLRIVWESIHYDREAIRKILANGRVRAVVYVPHGFSSELGRRLYVYVDGTDVLASNSVCRALQRIAASLGNMSSVEVVEFSVFNAKSTLDSYVVPSLYGMFLQSFPIMMQAMAVSVEREKQTIEQLIVTPARRLEILISKLLVYFAVGMTNAVSMIFVMARVFNLNLAGNMAAIVVVSATFLLANLGIGTLGSVMARTQLQAMQVLLPVIYTGIFLTGTFYPVETLPQSIQIFAYFLPLTYMNHSIRLLMKGATIDTIIGDIAFLAVFTTISLVLASMLFKKRME